VAWHPYGSGQAFGRVSIMSVAMRLVWVVVWAAMSAALPGELRVRDTFLIEAGGNFEFI
jgi:hypothetical protein